jgi:hypothetical protein
MAEISNKTLAVLLVGAIVVSLMGTLISLQRLSDLSPRGGQITGFATTNATGTVQVTVNTGASLAVRRNINFGSVTPNSTGFNISSDFNGPESNDCSTVGACSGLEIENDGNARINLTMNSSSNASDLIGGTNPIMSFYVANGNSSATGASSRPDSSCTNINSTLNVPWQNFQKNTNYVLCYSNNGLGGMWFNESNDTMTVEFNLTIPNDAAEGAKTATIMFYNDPSA